MSSISVEIKINDSFNQKVNADWREIFADIIHDVTMEAENRCKRECPVDTGALRRGHSSQFIDLTSYIKNSMDYWIYVVYGTQYMSANPYTKRVCESLCSEKWAANQASKILKNYGVIQ